MTTIYDVAKLAKVSPATVSRVLNGHTGVDPVLADRVRQATAELDFRRNAVARSLRRSRTTLWAVIISDIANPFFTAMVRGVEDVAQAAGYSVVLCNSDEDLKKEAAYLAAAVSDRMAGVIISPASERFTVLSPLLEAKIPAVLIDRSVRGVDIDSVRVDNTQGAFDATASLIAAGFRKIACITGPRRATTARERLDGYKLAHRKAGLEVNQELIRHADFRELGGHDAMLSLLALRNRPDAVFVANNLMTVGTLECLADNGIAIPDEMGLVGFDDLPWAQLIRPALSVVRQPTYEVGQAAGQLLLQRMAEPDRPPATVILRTTLRAAQSSTLHRSRTRARARAAANSRE